MFGVNGIYNGCNGDSAGRGSHQSLCHLKVGWGCRGSGLDSAFSRDIIRYLEESDTHDFMKRYTLAHIDWPFFFPLLSGAPI